MLVRSGDGATVDGVASGLPHDLDLCMLRGRDILELLGKNEQKNPSLT